MSAKPASGMDQDFYPWSPIVARPPLRWPEGARVALAASQFSLIANTLQPGELHNAVQNLASRVIEPNVTSHANHHYQKRFDKLAELAAAGDWDAVAGYECTGINSYAKMVRQYRDRLVAAHKTQQAAATATEQGAAQ